MKLLSLLLFAAAAFAQAVPPPPQVPTHSVVGNLTIDIVDVQIPVPYGPAETKAVISVCSSSDVSRLQMDISVLHPDGISHGLSYELVPPVKTATGACSSLVAIAERLKITYLNVTASNQASITPPPPPAVTAGSTAAPRR